MKLSKYLILPLLLVILISSCSPRESTTTEMKYLKQVEASGNFIAIHENNIRLLELGNLVCDSFDAGMTGDEVVQQVTSTGVYDTDIKIEFVGLVITSAMNTLCPEYLGEVR
jgi:hypothetical protein